MLSCILHLLSSNCFSRVGKQQHSHFIDGETEAAVSLGSLSGQSHTGNESSHSLISHPSACFISSLICVAQIPQSGHTPPAWDVTAASDSREITTLISPCTG